MISAAQFKRGFRLAFGQLGEELRAFLASCSGEPAMQEFCLPLARLAERVQGLTGELGARALNGADEVGAAASDYLRICGHLVFAWLWARMARLALQRQADGDAFHAAKLATARFYFARLLPEVEGLFAQIDSGAAPLMAPDADWF